jgi:undecaprenyl pyrophosphate phosphatase UppP
MACVLIVIVGFPVLAASVFSRWMFRYYLRENGQAFAIAAGIVSFVVSFVAVFALTAYIFTAKFRLMR